VLVRLLNHRRLENGHRDTADQIADDGCGREVAAVVEAVRLHRKAQHRPDVFKLHAKVVEDEVVHQPVRMKSIRYSL
jgi:hypothetical protein